MGQMVLRRPNPLWKSLSVLTWRHESGRSMVTHQFWKKSVEIVSRFKLDKTMCTLWHTGPQFYGKNLQFLWQFKAKLCSALKALWQLHKHSQTLEYTEQWAIWLHVLSGLKLLLVYSLNEAWSGVLAWWGWKELETEKGGSSLCIQARRTWKRVLGI